MPKPDAPSPAESDRLVEEMLGTAGPPLPDTPVLLGEFTPAEAEDMGAFHDDALAAAPELRELDRPWPPRQAQRDRPTPCSGPRKRTG